MARRVVGIVLAALVLSACTASSKTAAVISPSPTATIRLLTPLPSRATPPSQSHAATPARASGTRLTLQPWPTPSSIVRGSRSLALVHLAGTSGTVVRDVTDINNPSTVATVDVPDWYVDPRGALAFVGAAYVGAIRYPGDGTSQLVLTHYPDAPSPLIEAYGYGVAAFAWSPDGTSIAYLVDTWSTQRWEWHVASNGVDHFVAYTPGLCHCGEGIVDVTGIWLDYSQDGRYMSLVVTNGFGPQLQVRTADGVLVTSINGDQSGGNWLTMPVWSGNKLYFRDAQGVEVWDNGAVRPFLPGVAWADPRSSPAGGLIAYSAPDASGIPHAFTVETATGKVRQLAARGSHQVHFLTDRYVWYRGAMKCPPTEYCLSFTPGQGYKDTGVNYVFDLATDAESVSRLSGVADTWPHGA